MTNSFSKPPGSPFIFLIPFAQDTEFTLLPFALSLVESGLYDGSSMVSNNGAPGTLGDTIVVSGPRSRCEVSVNGTSLSAGTLHVSTTDCWNRIYDETEKEDLFSHRSYGVLRLELSTSSSLTRGALISKHIEAVLDLEGALGVLNPYSQCYTTERDVNRVLADPAGGEAGRLLRLLINVHAVPRAGNISAHTHGMEQFLLPELETVELPDHSDPSELQIVLEAVEYQIGDDLQARTEKQLGVVPGTLRGALKTQRGTQINPLELAPLLERCRGLVG